MKMKMKDLHLIFDPNEGWSFECQGMKNHVDRRFIMKALLETDDNNMTLCALVARAAAMVSYMQGFSMF